MIKSGHTLMRWIAFPIALTLAMSGCATKKYVRQQVSPVHQQVATLEKTTNDKVAYLHHQEERDISAVNERISTTDEQVAQVAQAAQLAQGTASRAMTQAEENSGKIEENSTALTNLKTGVTNALNYQLVDRADVMFGFNKSTLTPTGKRALDEIVDKAQTVPRTVIEVAGFADPVGTKSYNFALSRRRAEAVQRYLVERNVPVRSIHIVGFGEEAPPTDFQPENPPANGSRAARYQMARRAQVRLFAAGDLDPAGQQQ